MPGGVVDAFDTALYEFFPLSVGRLLGRVYPPRPYETFRFDPDRVLGAPPGRVRGEAFLRPQVRHVVVERTHHYTSEQIEAVRAETRRLIRERNRQLEESAFQRMADQLAGVGYWPFRVPLRKGEAPPAPTRPRSGPELDAAARGRMHRGLPGDGRDVATIAVGDPVHVPVPPGARMESGCVTLLAVRSTRSIYLWEQVVVFPASPHAIAEATARAFPLEDEDGPAGVPRERALEART